MILEWINPKCWSIPWLQCPAALHRDGGAAPGLGIALPYSKLIFQVSRYSAAREMQKQPLACLFIPKSSSSGLAAAVAISASREPFPAQRFFGFGDFSLQNLPFSHSELCDSSRSPPRDAVATGMAGSRGSAHFLQWLQGGKRRKRENKKLSGLLLPPCATRVRSCLEASRDEDGQRLDAEWAQNAAPHWIQDAGSRMMSQSRLPGSWHPRIQRMGSAEWCRACGVLFHETGYGPAQFPFQTPPGCNDTQRAPPKLPQHPQLSPSTQCPRLSSA